MIAALQLLVAFMIGWRAKAERSLWDKSGFALLAATAGLMAARRITAAMDSHVTADRIVLPTIITFVMLGAAVCFLLEAMHRMRLGTPPVTWRRVMWPSTLFAVAALAGEVPAQEQRSAASFALTFEECHARVLRAEGSEEDQVAAIRELQRHMRRSVELVSLISVCGDRQGEIAREAMQQHNALCEHLTKGNPK